MQYPSVIYRILAIAYDTFLIVAIWFISTVIVVALNHGQAIPAANLSFKCYLLAVGSFYILWFWTHGGQTTGMAAWHIKVVDESGAPLSNTQAILRLFYAIPLTCCLIGLLWAYFDPERRTLYDKWAKTKLIYS